MSLRAAINDKCRSCIFDPKDMGSAAQQIAGCRQEDCPLHPVRPVTAKLIPIRLLNHWGISRDDLCERARPLAEIAPCCSGEGQIDQLQSVKGSGNGDGRGAVTTDSEKAKSA